MKIQLLIAMGVVNFISMDTPIPKFATTYDKVTLRPGKSAGNLFHAKSPASCAAFCNRDGVATCSMASYSSSTGGCVLYHWTAVGTVSVSRHQPEANWTMVVVRKENSRMCPSFIV